MDVSLIATYGPFNAATRLERAVHAALSDSRMLGEWFDCDEFSVLKAVSTCLESFIDDADETEDERVAREKMMQEFARETLINEPVVRITDEAGCNFQIDVGI
ncbi:hypothetical protein C6T62_01840, partial [Burkholderia multivorans]